MNSNYSPINCGFHDILLANATQKKYCKIQYFTEIQELITIHSFIKNVYTTPEKEEFAELLLGEKVRLDKIVSIDGIISPNYHYFKDFSCDC